MINFTFNKLFFPISRLHNTNFINMKIYVRKIDFTCSKELLNNSILISTTSLGVNHNIFYSLLAVTTIEKKLFLSSLEHKFPLFAIFMP